MNEKRAIHIQMKWKIILSLLLILLAGCEFDKGLDVLKSRISGEVVFLGTESRPDNIDEVRVVAVANFPPSGLADVFFSEAIPFDRDTAKYEILLPLGDYPAVGVLWKPRGKDWAFTSLLGFYGFEPPASASLQPVTLTENEPIATDIDLFALWELARLDAEISGTVTFQGELPENTDTVLLAAFTGIPDLNNVISLLGILGGLPLPVPLNNISPGATYEFQLPVRSGGYKYLAAFWVAKGGFETIQLLGFLPDPQDPDKQRAFTLPADSVLSGLDFIADFEMVK